MNFQSRFADRINRYLDYREALGYSRKSDGAVLLSFDKYCCSVCPNATDVTAELVHAWLNSASSSNRHTAIRNFAKYLCAHDLDAYILPEKYSQPPINEFSIKPKIFSDGELRRLFVAIGNVRPSNDQPHLPQILPVLFRLIYTCGLRPNEGRELLRSNIDFKTGAITIVNTKGKKERIVVMSEDMLALCTAYDKQRESFAGANPYFFPARDGGVIKSSALQQYFRRCWAEANPNIAASELPSVRVYDLRHNFATTAMVRWIENGANLQAKLAYLQAYMGHGSLNETMYYVHLLPENLIAGGKWDTKLDLEVQPW